jgi:hypothetical protein
MKMRPNLFWHATSELSQDAVLCWLLSWADKTQNIIDPILHKVGTEFLGSIFEKASVKIPSTYEVEIRQQEGGIDILCIVNKETAIIIEDKTGTKQHSDQLPRYKEYVLSLGFSADSIIPIYLQTRDQSDYSEVTEHGYFVYERQDLLKVLEGHSGNDGRKNSDILSDYAAYLRKIEDDVQSFRRLPPKDWSWDAWKGFYSELQKSLGDGNWDYVANPSGGFLGFSWHFLGDEQCEQYLQLEQDKFCFKIWVNEPDKRRELRDFWHDRIIRECLLHGIKAKRPERFGNGNYMTVAIMDQEYRIVDDNRQLDFEKTLNLFRTAEAVLDALKV